MWGQELYQNQRTSTNAWKLQKYWVFHKEKIKYQTYKKNTKPESKQTYTYCKIAKEKL